MDSSPPATEAAPAEAASFCPHVYATLLRIARWHLSHEGVCHALEAADLVHEAYIRLEGPGRLEWANESQLYARASRAMRQILVDHARRRLAAKRGGGWRRVGLDADAAAVHEDADAYFELDVALQRLARVDARLCQVVRCRFFTGLSGSELAGALGVTDRTVRRDWAKAKAWLYRELMA
jgi:RNA polymerase sigma factor (TIGR02999 family)